MRRGPNAVVCALALVGCATEYRLAGIESELPPMPAAPGAAGGDGPIAQDPSAEAGSVEPPPLNHHQVVIGGGSRATVVDYLFVVDSSSSMQGIIGSVLAGFDALAEEDVFPTEARIAVMNTLPADPLRRGVVHPGAKSRWWLKFEPGFGEPVDQDRIEVFRELAPTHVSDRFPTRGCSAWFTPEERNADGVPCLVAHTQVALYPVGVEAGLTALGQRLERDPPLFRPGAAVNVVFVSDTHDPGLPATDPAFAGLLSARPTFAQLETLALSRQPLASFRVHAIAPAAVCTAEDWSAAGPAYTQAARDAGGRTLDSCGATPADYVAMVRHIATDGAVPQRTVIPVRDRMEVAEVRLDGEIVPFSISPDGRAITLPGALPDAARTVDVGYRER
ncbi:MAG: hypothetical protein ABMA64_23750 [Myxococcota bacterium]